MTQSDQLRLTRRELELPSYHGEVGWGSKVLSSSAFVAAGDICGDRIKYAQRLTPPNTLISEVSIKADADIVWRALRDPAEIRNWFGWQYDGLNDEIVSIFLESAEESATDRRLRWEHGDEFVVEPNGDFTTVRASRNGEFDPADWAEIDDGWISFLQQLRVALEFHLGEERRTIHIKPSDGEVLPDQDALDRLLSSSPGIPVELKPATGVEAAGEVQYCDGRQACVRVDAYGDGLVVLSPAHVIVTTYGLSDEDFAAVEADWQAAYADSSGSGAQFA